jgi:hypothetical protein
MHKRFTREIQHSSGLPPTVRKSSSVGPNMFDNGPNFCVMNLGLEKRQ